MTDHSDKKELSNMNNQSMSWQLSALTEALGDLTLTVNDSLSVGRGSDNDVVLGSKEVSRNHALLSLLNDKLYIKDLGSSNGTFINDERIENNKSKHLKADDKVAFASFIFQVISPMVATIDTVDTENSDTENSDTEIVDLTSKESQLTEQADVADVATLTTPVITDELVESSSTLVKTSDDNATVSIDESQLTAAIDPAIDSPVEPVVAEETILENNMPTATTDQGIEETVVTDELTHEVTTPVVKETIIKDVLSSTDSGTPTDVSEPRITTEEVTAMSTDRYNEQASDLETPIAVDPVADTLVSSESAIKEEPLQQEQETKVAEEHDKTTKTALQEEADPDVLRAKQAATGQFSGTANLGQSRDVGTEGNNAMDQAIDNPANSGYVEKKPSGGWFIWVFIAIIIIGLALWLFNMGGA